MSRQLINKQIIFKNNFHNEVTIVEKPLKIRTDPNHQVQISILSFEPHTMCKGHRYQLLTQTEVGGVGLDHAIEGLTHQLLVRRSKKTTVSVP